MYKLLSYTNPSSIQSSTLLSLAIQLTACRISYREMKSSNRNPLQQTVNHWFLFQHSINTSLVIYGVVFTVLKNQKKQLGVDFQRQKQGLGIPFFNNIYLSHSLKFFYYACAIKNLVWSFLNRLPIYILAFHLLFSVNS